MPCLIGKLLETAAVHFVRDEYVALLFWKGPPTRASSSSRSTLRAYVRRLRAGIGDGSRSSSRRAPSSLAPRRNLAERLPRPCLAEAIDDAVPRHAIQPGADLLDRFHQPVRFCQLVEGILQDVFGIPLVIYTFSE